MTKSLLCALFLCLVISFGAQAQTNNTSNLLKQLLDLPAPPPVNPSEEDDIETKPERAENFYESKNVPPDDAPIDVLLDFWERQNTSFDEFRYNFRPSKESLRRIIAEIEKDPQKLTSYLKLFPTDPDTADFVKKLYEFEKQQSKLSSSWLDTTRRWLRYNSDMYLSELLNGVREIDEENERLSNQADLIALAKVDWKSAAPFVSTFESSAKQSAIYTLAKYVLYHRALEEENSSDAEKYRGELQKIVEDKTASDKARDLAMDALVLGGDFEGRDEWYVSLLADETLLALQENGFTGLTTLVRYSPNEREKWIPLMTKLLGSNNPTLRSVAVRNLLQVSGFNKEIAILLLPWLGDPDWAGESGDSERDRLIEVLGEIDIPEGVPGLIQIVANEEGYERGLAAKSLVRYKSPSAIPALRTALQNETDTDYRANMIEALIVSGGISDDEQLAGLEAYALSISNKKLLSEDDEEEDYEEDDDDKPVPIGMSIGIFLKSYENPNDSLVARTIQRIKVLKKTNPKLATVLSGIILKWKNRVVDLEMLDWAGGAEANIEIILKVLIRREEMLERIPNELALMRDKNAILRALSVVISENTSEQAYMLNRVDAETQIALLAFARLVRAELPVLEVGALLNHPNKMLALAAERYLESEDSAEARKLILAQRKGEARILGAQQAFIPFEKGNYESYQWLLNELFDDVNGTSFQSLNLTAINKTENELRAEFKTETELLAIYAFIDNEETGQKVLRVYKDKIVFTYYEDEARYWEKHITSKEYETMYRFLIENRIDDLAPVETNCGRDCPNYEFVMFGRDGGRRIFYRQYYSTPEPLDALEEIFDSFNSGDRKLHYWLAEKIPGVEVLMASDKFTARAVWKNGNDFRVLVEDVEKEKNYIEDIEMQEKTEDSNENLTYAQRYEIQKQRRVQFAYKHFSWHKFESGQLSATEISQPSEIAYLSENTQVVSYSGKYIYMPTPKTFRRRAENFEVRTEPYYNGNLVKVFDSGASVIFKEGRYSKPFITPDGKWIIAAKDDENFSQTTCVVRIDLQTGKEFKINVLPADEFYPVAFADAQNRILLYRAKDEDNNNSSSENPSPKTPEYYLLDAATGAVQLIKGEFRPLEDQTFRSLQPTGNPNEFWAAIYDEKTNTTQIGFYDAKLFAFKPFLNLPKISLDSMDIWIDKPAAKLYFVYEGHLLALPLNLP